MTDKIKIDWDAHFAEEHRKWEKEEKAQQKLYKVTIRKKRQPKKIVRMCSGCGVEDEIPDWEEADRRSKLPHVCPACKRLAHSPNGHNTIITNASLDATISWKSYSNLEKAVALLRIMDLQLTDIKHYQKTGEHMSWEVSKRMNGHKGQHPATRWTD